MGNMRRPSAREARFGLLRRFGAHKLFKEMVARQGIDLESVRWLSAETMVYRALHSCANCPRHEACRAWLASAAPPMSYARFCPNAETIEALRIAQR